MGAAATRNAGWNETGTSALTTATIALPFSEPCLRVSVVKVVCRRESP